MKYWTEEERKNYVQIKGEVLSRLYLCGKESLPTKAVEKRTTLLLNHLDEELSGNIFEKNGLNYSFADVLQKFADKKSNEGLNMLEEMTLYKSNSK